MKHSLTSESMTVSPLLPWWTGGVGIGVILILATALVQPIGVSTQYVMAVGILLHRILPSVAVQSPYLIETVAGWTPFTYEFMFVTGIPLGAFLSSVVTWRLSSRVLPGVWERRFGPIPGRRLVWSFIGGFILLFGARFGGGCTSGHMISGVSQLAVSSLIFSAAVFLSGILTARWLYGKGDLP